LRQIELKRPRGPRRLTSFANDYLKVLAIARDDDGRYGYLKVTTPSLGRWCWQLVCDTGLTL